MKINKKKKTRQNIISAVSAILLIVFIAAGCSVFSKLADEKTSSGSSDNSSDSNSVTPAKPTVPASTSSPPTPGFEKFAVVETENFTMEQAFSVFNKDMGYLKNIDYRYKYTDKRNAKLHGEYGVDAQLQIMDFGTPEKVQERLKQRVKESIPIEKADTVKLPRCVGEKSDSDEFLGPDKLVKTLKHPNGSDIVILRSGDFNMYDCKRGSNESEYAVWTDENFYFTVHTGGHSKAGEGNPYYTGYGRAEEFAIEYLKSLGQAVSQ